MLKILGQLLDGFESFRRALHKNPGGWKYRLIEAQRYEKAMRSKKGGVAFMGDSIFHFGEKQLSTMGDDYAVGGYTTEDVLRVIRAILTLARPRLVILHIGGNDLLRGRPVSFVYSKIKEIEQICKEMNVKLKWVEVVPLGDPADYPDNPNRIHILKTNDKAIELCAKLRGVEVRKRLSKKNSEFLRKEYGAGDMVHVNEKAYDEVYVPVLRCEL